MHSPRAAYFKKFTMSKGQKNKIVKINEGEGTYQYPWLEVVKFKAFYVEWATTGRVTSLN